MQTKTSVFLRTFSHPDVRRLDRKTPPSPQHSWRARSRLPLALNAQHILRYGAALRCRCSRAYSRHARTTACHMCVQSFQVTSLCSAYNSPRYTPTRARSPDQSHCRHALPPWPLPKHHHLYHRPVHRLHPYLCPPRHFKHLFPTTPSSRRAPSLYPRSHPSLHRQTQVTPERAAVSPLTPRLIPVPQAVGMVVLML